MPRLPGLVTSLCVAAWLTGCATGPKPVGRDYDQSAFVHFSLDETTVADAEAALGPPMRQSTMSGIAKPGVNLVTPGTQVSFTSLNYYWAPNGFGMPRDQHPTKSAVISFLNGHLAEYTLSNAIPGEVTPPIDEARLTELHQGQTTRAQAIDMFGPPLRQFLHMLDAQRGASEIAYGWTRLQAGNVNLRTLRIYFDRAGLLSSYAVLDNSFPANSAPMLQLGPQSSPQGPPQGAPGTPFPHPLRPQVDREHT